MLAECVAAYDTWRPVIDKPGLWIGAFERSPNDCTETVLPDRRGAIAGMVFDSACRRVTSISGEAARRIDRSEGKSLLADFWGRYILFLKSADETQHAVVRDPSAALPCYYTSIDGVTLVFSDLETCPFSSVIPLHIDWDFIKRFLLHDKMLTGATGLKGVYELLPGERIVFRGEKHAKGFVWRPHEIYGNDRPDDPNAALESIRAIIPGAINAWGDAFENVLLKLSGGLDSSIVLSALNKGRAQVTCINYRSDENANNDRDYARLMAEFAGVPLLEFKSIDNGQTLAAASDLDSLPITPKPSRHYVDITAAKFEDRHAMDEDTRAILGGQGGDHLFLDAPRADSLGDYVRHHGLGSDFWRVAWETAALTERSVWSVLHQGLKSGMMQDAVDPLSDRPQLRTGLVSASVMDQIDFNDLKHPWLKDQAGMPPAKFRQISDYIVLLGVLEPYRKGQNADVVQPLMSQPVVELFFQIPTYLLSYQGVRRGLVRAAFRDKLPSKIIRRVRKGGSMSRQYSSIIADGAELLSQRLLHGELAGKGLFNGEALEKALTPSALMRGKMQHSDIMRRYLCVEMWVRKVQSYSPDVGSAVPAPSELARQ